MIILLFDKNIRVFFFSDKYRSFRTTFIYIWQVSVLGNPRGSVCIHNTCEITIGTWLHLGSPLVAFRVKCCWFLPFSGWLLNPEYSWGYFHFTASKSDLLFYCYKVSSSLYLAVKIEVGRAAVQNGAGSKVNGNKSKQELSQLNRCYDEFDQKENGNKT